MQFDEEAEEFGEDFLSDKDPSILHFLLASGDEVTAVRPHACLPACNPSPHLLPASLSTSAEQPQPVRALRRSPASSCATTS